MKSVDPLNSLLLLVALKEGVAALGHLKLLCPPDANKQTASVSGCRWGRASASWSCIILKLRAGC